MRDEQGSLTDPYALDAIHSGSRTTSLVGFPSSCSGAMLTVSASCIGGNTRVVVGEGKNKKVLAGAEDEPFDDSMIPMRRFADYQAQAYSGVQQPGVAANKAASVSGFSMMNPQGSPSAYAGSVSGMPLARGSSASFAQLPSAMHLGELPRPMSYMSPYGTPTAFPSPSVMGMPAYTGSMMGMQPPTAPWATGMPRHSSSGSLGGGSAHGSDTAPLRESRSYSPLNVVSNRPLSTFSSSPGGLGGSPPGLGSAQNRQSNFSLFSNFNMPSVSESTNPSLVTPKRKTAPLTDCVLATAVTKSCATQRATIWPLRI